MIKTIKTKNILFALLLCSIIFAVFYPILNNDFLYEWDDQWVVLNHYTDGGFYIENVWAIFSEFYHGQYSPLNEFLYFILYSLFGYKPLYFHLASLLIHCVNALLAYKCFTLLLETNTKIKIDYYRKVAFLTALIFSIHPFNVESVAWISASKVLVYSFYYLVATYFFIKYLNEKKIKFLIFTTVFFIFSFLGKEQAVTFPVWMLLIYWISGYSLKNKTVWITTVPFILLSIIGGIITILSQSSNGGGLLSDEPSYELWQRFIYACYTFCEYIFKSIFPFKLSYLYPFPTIVGESLPIWILVYPILLAVSIIAFWKQLLKNKVVSFCLIFFFIHIAVALHIIPLSRFAIVADRYAYISSLGVCFALSYIIVYLYRNYKKRGKVIIIASLLCYLAYLGIYSNIRCRVWHNSDTLKEELTEQLMQRYSNINNSINQKEIEEWNFVYQAKEKQSDPFQIFFKKERSTC